MDGKVTVLSEVVYPDLALRCGFSADLQDLVKNLQQAGKDQGRFLGSPFEIGDDGQVVFHVTPEVLYPPIFRGPDSILKIGKVGVTALVRDSTLRPGRRELDGAVCSVTPRSVMSIVEVTAVNSGWAYENLLRIVNREIAMC